LSFQFFLGELNQKITTNAGIKPWLEELICQVEACTWLVEQKVIVIKDATVHLEEFITKLLNGDILDEDSLSPSQVHEVTKLSCFLVVRYFDWLNNKKEFSKVDQDLVLMAMFNPSVIGFEVRVFTSFEPLKVMYI
jgi:hypothetical protein